MRGAQQIDLPEPCADGEHIPVVLHRTGGPGAWVKNTCGKCGSMIEKIGGVWKIDEERERAPQT